MQTPFDDDSLKEECGVFGIADSDNAAVQTMLGLHALQHRGQEAAGIVSFDGEDFHAHRAEGHVTDEFNHPHILSTLSGRQAIGHVRYSTTGESSHRNIQPVFAELSLSGLAVAHNGNLTNTGMKRKELIDRGCIFQSTMDTEIIIHLIAISKQQKFLDRVVDALKQIEGAYSLIILSRKKLIGVRDPLGVRPLVLGKLGKSYVFASETCALDIIGADYIREVEPGEMIVIENNELQSHHPFENTSSRFCIFEYVYFSRPDSHYSGKHVYRARKAIGRELAKESVIDADVVVPVPDSGVPSALGFAEQANIPFEFGIIRNHYIGRTFIQPTDTIRHLGVKLKHNANLDVLKGKRVVLVDDSIVRGTTSKKIVNMVREAGASEVHMRIASPPTSFSCFYGIDTPDRSKLIASHQSVEQIAEFIGADSLAYLSIDGLYRAVGEAKRDNDNPAYCDACFTGDYPIPTHEEKS